ncbi:MAG: hypothetical protein HC893_03215 [Chloroflexaceae bacterium]|nr:hypothetical protein [Chloroflexaceae bacterium]
MAIALQATPDVLTVTVTYEDWRGQRRTHKYPLLGATVQADIVTFLTDLQSCINGKIISASVTASYEATGFVTATTNNDRTSDIQHFLALNFTAPNPINASKKVYKTANIPSFKSVLEASNGSGVALTGDTNLDRIVATLIGKMVYVGANGTVYGGAAFWTYLGGRHLSAAEIVDNT